VSIGKQPAFPTFSDAVYQPDCSGMSYRQWLVGMALQGLLAKWDPSEGKDVADHEDVAFWSVQYADATIRELEQTP
jgi:hypothetical protein